jgi:uncharacterized protein
MKKYDRLCESLKKYNRLAVALSGGADSALVLSAALAALGPDCVLAMTIISPLMPENEAAGARKLAASLGAEHVFVSFDAIPPEVSANGRDRCYFCKRSMLGAMIYRASESGYAVVAEGSNLDDLSTYRPGLRAVRELGAISPLIEAGFTKSEVYEALRELKLPVCDKPSSACLATRIPYGTELTDERLKAVGEGEEMLRSYGFNSCRLRHHGDIARIEVPKEDFQRLCQSDITASIRRLGFTYVTMDLDGLRSGSMDEAPEIKKGQQHEPGGS